MPSPARGRPRDPSLDAVILEVARRHLAESGYEAMSLVAIADEAGTTRQTLYRRWPTKADLATAAIAAIAVEHGNGVRSESGEQPDEPSGFDQLVRELESFRRGVSRPDGLSMVGTMLHRGTDEQLVALYRERVVAPRRAALRAILEAARDRGELDGDADIRVAVTMLTGSWYARALAGEPEPRGWATRAAVLVWRALGGEVGGPAG